MDTETMAGLVVVGVIAFLALVAWLSARVGGDAPATATIEIIVK